MFAELVAKPAGKVARKEGDAAAALASAGRKIEAVYEAPFLSHAPMEPMNCTAHVRADGCDVWAPTQMQTPSRDVAAQVTGLTPEQVKIHSQFMGGGFGRRGSADYVAEAVEIAKAVKAPVKLTWSREDDMQHDLYRPAAMVKFTASLDASGMPAALEAKVASPPFGFVRNGRTRHRRGGPRGSRIHDSQSSGRLSRRRSRHSGHLLALGRLLAEHVLRRELHR